MSTKLPKKTKLFIEAVPLVDRQVSGIPHALAGVVAALAANKKITDAYEIVLVAPAARMHLLDRWPGLEGCTRKAIPMKFRIMNGLGRRGLLPPMDLLLGSGVYVFGNYFNWPLTRRSKSLTYIHDACFAVFPQYVQPDNMRMLQKNVPRYIRQTDYVVTVSESAKKEIVERFDIDNEHVLVAYNGVDTSLYKQYSTREVAEVRKKYELGDKPYILFVGNIEPRKNLERLVKAMEFVPKEYTLMMVGSDGWLNEKVFAAMDRLNKMGHRIIKPKTFVPDEDVVRLMSGSTALALPSLHEGFGMPALEAIVSKTVVVVGDIPPLHEVAADAGIFCDPHSIKSIAEGLNKAINMAPAAREKLVAKGYAHGKQFTWERGIVQLTDTLLGLASKAKRS